MPDEADEFLSKWGGAAAPAAPPDEAEAFLSKWGGTPNLAKRAINAPVATVKDVRDRIFGPQTDYSGQPPVLSGAFRGPPREPSKSVGDMALDAAASAGWGIIEGTTQAADAFGRMGRGIVDVANEGVKAAFGRGFDLGEASDRPITGLADPLMAKAGQTRTLDDARADARAEGHGTALDVGGKIGEKGAGLIAMMAGAQPVAAGLAKAGVVGPLNNVLSFAGGSVLTDPKHPVSAAINGAFSGVGGEMGSALVKAPAAALLARWAGQNGERAVHVLRGLAFGAGMAAAPHVDESGGLHNVLMEGDGLAAAETILLPALLHAGASRESVRAAADSLRADAAKVAADPVRDEPTNVTLWRGRMREAEAEGARLREQAKAEAAAEAATHPNAEPTPGEPVEVTLKRGENRLAAQAAPEAAAAPREEVIQPRAGEIVPSRPVAEGEVRPRSVLDAAEKAGYPGAKEAREAIDALPDSTTRWDPVNKEWTRTPDVEAKFEPPAAPELTLVGRTNKGVGVYQRPGYQPGDTLVTRTDSGRLGAAHPGEVAEARANAAKADKATSAANIDAAVEGIRGGKPARVPKTERGAQAGIGNPLEMAATVASLPRKAFGAIQQGEKAVMERVKTVLSRVAGDIPVGRGLTARDLIGIAKERLEPNVMGREMRNRIDEIGYERAAAKMDSGEAFKGLKVTDPATAERVTDYFEGRATQAEAQAALDPKSHKVLEWAANQRDVNQRELIDLGVLTQEMVDNLKGGGQYATRSYEAVLEGVAEQQGIVSNGKRIPKMWERKDLSPERRQQLGEIRDPRVVIATTLAKQGSLLPMARLFRDVAANPRQASLEGGEGWTREPLPNQPTRYGKLAGMYVRRPFKKWLDSVQGERTATDAVADVVNGWVADWKFGAVSGRPASLLRDVMGNELFGEFSNRSHADLTNLVDDAGAVRIMRSKPGTPEYDLLKRFVEKGVTDGSSFEPDTLKMLEEVTRAPGRNMPEKIKAYVKDKLSAVAHGQLNRAIPGTEVVARVRQLQDAFFRVRALHHDIRKGATVDEAIAQVRLDYPYFGGNVAGAVMRAKGLPMAALRAAGPIPPFLNFMEWGAKWAVRQAINRPATSAALVGGLSALSSAVAKMAGLSDEDRRRMEAAIPKYRRPSLLRPLVGVDDNGNPTVIDLSYVVPMGNELETAIATMKAMTGSSDEIDDDGMRGLPVGPAMALFAQIGMNKKMFSDTPINTSQDPAFGSRTSAPEGRRQMLRYIAEGMIPTVRDVGKFYRAVKGVPLDSKGKIQPDVLLTALDTFAGVKIRTSDVATDRYHSLLGATQIIQEKLRGWEKVQKDPRIDPADLPEREREFAADIMDIYLKTLPFRVKGARNVVEKIQSTMDAQSVVGDLRGETNAAREAANPGGK